MGTPNLFLAVKIIRAEQTEASGLASNNILEAVHKATSCSGPAVEPTDRCRRNPRGCVGASYSGHHHQLDQLGLLFYRPTAESNATKSTAKRDKTADTGNASSNRCAGTGHFLRFSQRPPEEGIRGRQP